MYKVRTCFKSNGFLVPSGSNILVLKNSGGNSICSVIRNDDSIVLSSFALKDFDEMFEDIHTAYLLKNEEVLFNCDYINRINISMNDIYFSVKYLKILYMRISQNSKLLSESFVGG